MQIARKKSICCGYTHAISLGDVDDAFKVLDTLRCD
jgi:hypothetical protein